MISKTETTKVILFALLILSLAIPITNMGIAEAANQKQAVYDPVVVDYIEKVIA